MEILIKDQLSSDERNALFNWGEQVFPVECRVFTWAPPHNHIVVLDNSKPVAHLGFGIYNLVANGIQLKSVGVGGVVVRPEYQKRNIPQLMFHTLHSMEKYKVTNLSFSLFCPERLVSYYVNHGYSLVPESVQFRQGDEYIDSGTAKFMVRGALFKGDVKILGEPW